MNSLLIRADSSEKIGTGHIMRCIALAQVWQDTGGYVVFVISTASKPLEDRICREGFSVLFLKGVPGSREDAEETLAIAQEKNAGWIILDGYHFGDDFQERVKGKEKLLVIDDYGHAKNIHADIVLNPNVYASEELYPHHRPGTRFLLGGKYTLLRREFLTKGIGSAKKPAPSVKKILVTMGGSDPDNVTTTVLDSLRPLITEYSLSVTAVVGGMNTHFYPSISPYAEDESVKIVRATGEMPALIGNADVVITGAGSTVWEIAFLGRPMIAVVLTGNQEKVGTALQQAGAAMVIGDRKQVPGTLILALLDLIRSPEKCSELAASGQKLVDGEGAARVVMAMQEWSLRLRGVREGDKELLLRWANDPAVRKNAFSGGIVDPITHEQWFAAKLQSPGCRIYIAVDADDTPVGQVRFDRHGDSAEVDISIDSSQRMKGRGVELLVLGTAKIFHETDIKNINASVKIENTASIRMFEQAGFTAQDKEMRGGTEVVQFALSRPPVRGYEVT